MFPSHDNQARETSEAERELHIFYLENKIKSSGDPEEDFRTAQTMVNAIKLKNQAVLQNISPTIRNHSTAQSVQVNKNQMADIKLTPEEDLFYRDAKIRGINLTKEEIIAMRKK